MKDRGIVVLSGIGTRVIDRIASRLTANGLAAAFVEIRNGALDEAYFQRLVAHTLVVLDRTRSRGDVSISAFLVSGLADGEQSELESRSFFPALRRVSVDPAWRNNPAAAARIADAAIGYFQDGSVKNFIRSVSIRRDARLLLPLRNARCKLLTEQFGSIYLRDANELSGRVTRDVVPVRGRKCFRIYGIDFTPVENGGRHPVRRCSDTARCDLEGAFRFGATVPERVEFDVSCETGLRNKTFRQCDDTPAAFNREPTHVNMRINGDFEFA